MRSSWRYTADSLKLPTCSPVVYRVLADIIFDFESARRLQSSAQRWRCSKCWWHRMTSGGWSLGGRFLKWMLPAQQRFGRSSSSLEYCSAGSLINLDVDLLRCRTSVAVNTAQSVSDRVDEWAVLVHLVLEGSWFSEALVRIMWTFSIMSSAVTNQRLGAFESIEVVKKEAKNTACQNRTKSITSFRAFEHRVGGRTGLGIQLIYLFIRAYKAHVKEQAKNIKGTNIHINKQLYPTFAKTSSSAECALP